MSIFRKWTYQFFWGLIPLFFILSFLGRNFTVDIQMHDTYFVVSPFHIGQLLCFEFFIFGLIYWLLRKNRLLSFLTSSHILFTITCTIIVILYHLFNGRFQTHDLNFLKIGRTWYSIIILLYVISQILFLVNIIYALITNRKLEH